MLEVRYLKTDKLIPYINNSRTHSDSQVTQVAASIKEFGFTNPILIDEDFGVIAGHGRLMAAKKLGMDTVPTIKLDGLTDAQRKAYVIADNKLAANAGWDDEMLKIELEDLPSALLEMVGFNPDELNAIFNGWETDIDLLDKHGEHLDGIRASLKITVEQDVEQFARETITNALDSAGIDYEW